MCVSVTGEPVNAYLNVRHSLLRGEKNAVLSFRLSPCAGSLSITLPANAPHQRFVDIFINILLHDGQIVNNFLKQLSLRKQKNRALFKARHSAASLLFVAVFKCLVVINIKALRKGLIHDAERNDIAAAAVCPDLLSHVSVERDRMLS
jgi:hypothetical protein